MKICIHASNFANIFFYAMKFCAGSIQGFPKEDLAMGFAASNPESVGYVVAFKGVSSSSATLPKNIEVAIRPYSYSSGWATEDTFPIFQSNTPRNWMFPGKH